MSWTAREHNNVGPLSLFYTKFTGASLIILCEIDGSVIMAAQAVWMPVSRGWGTGRNTNRIGGERKAIGRAGVR